MAREGDRLEAAQRPISDNYPELALAVRRLLGHEIGSSRPYLSFGQAEQRTGLDKSTIRDLSNGTRSGRKAIVKFGRAMGLNGSEIIHLLRIGHHIITEEDIRDLQAGESSDILGRIGEEINPQVFAGLPLFSSPASAALKADTGNQEGAMAETLGSVLPASLRCIRVVGDCMEPLFKSGDIVLVRPTSVAENGNKVIARIDDDDRPVCKVYRSDGDHHWLETANGHTERIDQPFFIEGVVEYYLRQA